MIKNMSLLPSFINLKSSRNIFLIFIFTFGCLHLILNSNSANAESAGLSYMRCDRMTEDQDPGDCLIVFTTSSANFTEAYFKLTLDSEWVSATHFSTTASHYTVSTSGLPAGVTAMPGIGTANQVSSNTIRFPVTAMANSTAYGFYITGTGLIANPDASDTIIHTLFTRNGADDTTGDTKNVAVPTISNDQIVITATVAPTFTISFANNAQSLGTLSASSITSGSGTALTLSTNAANGWNVWVKDTSAGLASVSASKTIATTGTLNDSPSSLSVGAEGYVLDVNITTDAGSGGTVSIADEYNGGDTSSGGTLSSSTFQLVSSANGTANGDIITLIPRASIAGGTPAATDYTDTLTVVGAGLF